MTHLIGPCSNSPLTLFQHLLSSVLCMRAQPPMPCNQLLRPPHGSSHTEKGHLMYTCAFDIIKCLPLKEKLFRADRYLLFSPILANITAVGKPKATPWEQKSFPSVTMPVPVVPCTADIHFDWVARLSVDIGTAVATRLQ